MIKKYNGILGSFEYEDTEFKIIEKDEEICLHYIGKEPDGDKIKIPEGIVDCNHMFFDCSILKKAPIIPESVISCVLERFASSILPAPNN